MEMWDGSISQDRSDEAEIQMRPRLSLLSASERAEFDSLTEVLEIMTGTDNMNSDAVSNNQETKSLQKRRIFLLMKQLRLESNDRDR